MVFKLMVILIGDGSHNSSQIRSYGYFKFPLETKPCYGLTVEVRYLLALENLGVKN